MKQYKFNGDDENVFTLRELFIELDGWTDQEIEDISNLDIGESVTVDGAYVIERVEDVKEVEGELLHG